MTLEEKWALAEEDTFRMARNVLWRIQLNGSNSSINWYCGHSLVELPVFQLSILASTQLRCAASLSICVYCSHRSVSTDIAVLETTKA